MIRYLWLPQTRTVINLALVALVEDDVWVGNQRCVQVTFPGGHDPTLVIATHGVTRCYSGEDAEVLRKWMALIATSLQPWMA